MIAPSYLCKSNNKDNVKGTKHTPNKSKMNPSIVTLCNKGMIELTDNLIKSIKQSGMDNDIYIICLDNPTKNHFKYHNRIMPKSLGKGQPYYEYGTKEFSNVTFSKVPGIKSVLHKTKNDVIFIDSDIIVLRDFNNFIDLISSNYDLIVSLEPNNYYCAGLVYYKYSKNTFNFIQKYIFEMQRESDVYFDDQTILNEIIGDINHIGLYECLFCNGYYAMTNKINMNCVYTIHANWVKGFDNKMRFLKEFEV